LIDQLYSSEAKKDPAMSLQIIDRLQERYQEFLEKAKEVEGGLGRNNINGALIFFFFCLTSGGVIVNSTKNDASSKGRTEGTGGL